MGLRVSMKSTDTRVVVYQVIWAPTVKQVINIYNHEEFTIIQLVDNQN